MVLLPALIIALGGWREPLALADVLGDRGVELRERTIAFLIDRLRTPHFEPTNRLRYWLAYADDRQARALRRQITAASTAPQRVDISTAAYVRMAQASFLTREFGLDDPGDWSNEARSLGAPSEFISPYIRYIEEHSNESAWTERIWLARIDPSTLPDLETRFARERPGDSLDHVWASTLESGMALPEGSITMTDGESRDFRRSLGGRWTVLVMWDATCDVCRGDLDRIDVLARSYPSNVLLLTTGDAESVRLALADRGVTIPAAVVAPAVIDQLRAQPGSHLLVSPRLLFNELRGPHWEDDARRALQAR